MRSAPSRLPLLLAFATIGCLSEPVDNTPAAISVSPKSPSLVVGDTIRFTAAVVNARGDTLSASGVSWASNDVAKLTIDSTGLATVLVAPSQNEPVQVTVTASYGALSGSTSAAVVWSPPIGVWPDTNVLFIGATRRLVVRSIISNAPAGPPDRVEAAVSAWKSSDPSIAEVSSTGVVTAKTAGQVRITASSGRRVFSGEVYVRSPMAPLRFVDASGSVGIFGTANGEPKTTPRGCGLTDSGDVYCWGLAAGSDTPTDRCETSVRNGPGSYSIRQFRCTDIPYKLSSPVAFTAIAARGDQGCGIATTKRVYCWGSTGPAVPIVSNDEFISIHLPTVSSSLYYQAFNCGLRTDRVLVCWGGPIGAISVMGTTTWRSFAGAGRCGIADDGVAYCVDPATKTLQRVGTNSGWTAISTSGPGSYPAPGNQSNASNSCVVDASGQVSCNGSSTTPFTAVTGVPSVSRIDMFGLLGSEQCGLSADSDVYCFFQSDRKVDLGGVKLKRFFGTCGMSVDDKVYCYTHDPVTGVVAFRRIQGQQ
jgi:hypothetical protein